MILLVEDEKLYQLNALQWMAEVAQENAIAFNCGIDILNNATRTSLRYDHSADIPKAVANSPHVRILPTDQGLLSAVNLAAPGATTETPAPPAPLMPLIVIIDIRIIQPGIGTSLALDSALRLWANKAPYDAPAIRQIPVIVCSVTYDEVIKRFSPRVRAHSAIIPRIRPMSTAIDTDFKVAFRNAASATIATWGGL